MTLVVNGRFLAAEVTGLQRTARSLLDAALAEGLDARVLAPATAADPRVHATGWAPGIPGGNHVWEQFVLPRQARGARILSLTNTAPLAARRSVVWVHDLAPLVGPRWFAPSMRGYGALVLAAARRAERVLTVSHTVAGELTERGVAPERIRVVSPALDADFAPAPPEQVAAARARHGLTRPYALFVGWADPRKDLPTALAAHRRARDLLPHDLVLVGRPHRTFAPVDTGAPDEQSVRRLGYLPDGDLVALLTGAAVLLYPSRYEGFGLPPQEAQACGTPALAADIPVLRESTAGTVALLPPGDVDAWTAGLLRALGGGLPCAPPPRRTWADAGRDLLAALA